MVVDPIGESSPNRSYSQNGLRVIRATPTRRAACSEDLVPIPGRDGVRGGLRISTTITPRASTQLRAPERPEGPKEEEHEVR